MLDTRTADAGKVLPPLPGQPTGVFSAARPTFAAAVNDFFDRRPPAVQPLEFPHNTHIAKDIACDTCHEGVATGPVASLPSVKVCMVCHEAIATDRPLIKQITAMRDEGRDFAWQRVYGFTKGAHVKFDHAPHIRAKVDCTACHGDLSKQTVAERKVDHTMGFCVNCHNQKKASIDCLTCHY